jgi:hypothetical protein
LQTECNQEAFGFTAHFSRRVEAGFSAEQVSTDGGSLLLREVDRRINLMGRLAGCFIDGRALVGQARVAADAGAANLWAGAGL